MTVVINGAFRAPPEHLEALRPHMMAMLAASRAEDGCNTFAYSIDVAEPGLIRITESWRDADALAVHAAAPHVKAWMAARDQFGVHDRKLTRYEIADERTI